MSGTLPNGYSLRLADGQQWCIIPADEAAADIVHKMSRIIGLRPSDGNGSNNIIVTKRPLGTDVDIIRDVTNYGQFKGYPREGWSIIRQDPVRVWQHDDVPEIICEMTDYDKEEFPIENLDFLEFQYVVFSLYPIYKSVIDRGGLALHAAMMELAGRGVVIAAEAGTGKSTCYRRIEKPWRAVSEEEALVVRVGDRYVMHPMPTWKNHYEIGQEDANDVQQQVPLSAIFFLEQGKSDKVTPVGKGEAALMIYKASVQILNKYWTFLEDTDAAAFRKQLLDNACAIAARVPAFRLQATLTGKFWEEMEKVLPKS